MIAKRPLILIVDDAPEDIAIYKRHLTRGQGRRYKILEARTGAKALAICQRHMPDCVLLDFRMPDLNGLEVLQALADKSGSLPCAVVMLAEIGDTHVVVDAMKYGAHDFLEKNWVTPEMLERAIANAIEKAALQREVEEQRRELAIKNLMLEQRLADLQREVNERRQVKEALTASERRFKRLVEALPGVAWMSDAMGSVTYINDYWTELTGLTFEQSLGAGWLAAVHPDDAPRLGAEWNQAVLTGAPHESRHRYLRPDGEYRWHMCRAVPLRDEDGGVQEWVGFSVDIHVRHEAEKALGDSEARYRALVEASSQLVWTADANGISDRCWAWWSEITGVPAAKLAGGRWIATVHPDDRQVMREAWRRSRKAQALFEVEFRLRARDGAYRHYSARGVPLLAGAESNGHFSHFSPLSWIGTLDDVTDRRRAEEALRLANERFTVAEAAANGYVFDRDPVTNHVGRSRGFGAVMGYDESETAQSHDWWKTLIHPDDVHRVKAMLNQASLGQGMDEMDGYSIEYRILHKEGRYLWVWDRGRVMRDETGRVKQVIGSVVDISGRKQIENSLRENESRLKLAIAAMNGGAWEWDLISNEVRWSDEMYELFDLRPSDFRPTVESWLETLSTADRARALEVIEAVHRGEDAQLVYCTTGPDGGARWLELRGITLHDDRGRPVLLVGITIDITERKLAEEARRESEARVHTLAANLSDGLIYQMRLSPEGSRRFLYISENVERLRGVTAEEAMADANKLYNLIPEDYRARLIEAEEAALRDFAAFRFETPFLTPGGELRWSQQSSTPRRLSDGSVVWDGVEIDITERKRAEETLRESEEKFSKVFKASSHRIAIATLDEGRYIDVNDAVLLHTGYERSEMIGHTGEELKMFALPGIRGRLIRELQNGPVHNMEVPLRSKNGEVRTVLMSADVITLKGQKCLLAISNDITERKRAEEALRESEEKFSKAFKASSHRISIWTLDEGLCIDANDATSNSLGYERSEMIGRSIHELGIFAGPDGLKGMLEEVRNGPVRNVELQLRSKNGELRTVLWSAEIITLNGRPCLLNISNDITERKRAEEALRESEERLNLAMEAAGTFAWETDLATGRVTWSDSGEQIMGMTPGAFGGTYEAFLALIHPEDRESVIKARRRALDGEAPYEVEYRKIRPDGGLQWGLSRGIVYRDEEGRPARFVGVNVDITERKRVEEELREKERFIQSLIDAVPAGIYIYDLKERRNFFTNPRLSSMLGYTADELTAMGADFLPLLLHTEDWRQAHAHFETLREAPDGSVLEIEYRMKHRDGQWRWVASREMVFMRDAEGWPLQILGVAQEITERKQAEEDLQRANRRYQVTLDALDGYIYEYNVSDNASERSKGLAKLIGFEPEDAAPVLEWWVDRIHPDDRDHFSSEVRRMLAEESASRGETHYSIEYRLLHREGCYVDVLDRFLVMRGADGRPVQVVGVVINITQRKRVEEALRENEERLRMAMEAANAGSFDWDIASGIIVWTSGRHSSSDAHNTEQDYQSWRASVHPQDIDWVEADIAKCLAERRDLYIEYRVLRPDGSVRWASNIGHAFYDEAGQAVRMKGLRIDLTDRKRAEELLRESEERLRLALEGAKAGVWEVKFDPYSAYWSKEYRDLFGFSEDDEATNEMWATRIHPDDLQRVVDANNELLSSEEKEIGRQEFRIIHPVHGERWILDFVRVRRDQAGRPVSFGGINLDVTDRRRAEEAMRESEERFRELVETISNVFWIMHPESQAPTYLSPACERLWGRPAADLNGSLDKWFDAIHPEDRERVWKKYLARAGEGDYDETYRVVRPDGSTVWVHDRGFPVRDEAGNIRHIVGVAEDITDRKLVEDELRESERRYAALAEAVPQLVWTAGPDGGVDYFNKRWYAYTGTTPDDSLNQGWRSLIHPDDRERVEKLWKGRLRVGEHLHFEFRLRGADGAYRWFIGRGVPYRDERRGAAPRKQNGENPAHVGNGASPDGGKGRIVKWFGTFTDIHDLKMAEEALRESEEQARRQNAELENIYQAAPVGLSLLDRDFRFVRLNETMAKIEGASVAQALGRTAREVTPQMADRLEPVFKRVIRTGRPIMNLEIRAENPREPGVERDFLASYYPVKAADGSVQGIGCVVLDITERKRAEEAVRESEERLRQAAQAGSFGLYSVNLRTGENYWSPELRRIFGLSDDDAVVLGSSLVLIHPDDREETTRVIEASLDPRGDGEFEHEFRAQLPDGSTRWALARGKTLFNGNGRRRKATRIIGVAFDITARKEAEERLHESEELFRTIFDLSGIGNLQLDPSTGGFIRANREFRDWLGYSEGELSEMKLEEVVHPDDLEDKLANIGRLLRGEVDEHFTETRCVRKDGEVVWGLITSRILRDASGRPLGAVTAVTDITERKRAEEALRESERRLKLSLAAGRAGTWEWRIKEDKLIGSDEYYDLYGMAPGDLEPTLDNFILCVHPEDRDRILAEMSEVLQERKDAELEFRFIRAGGEARWAHSSAQLTLDEAGEPEMMVGIMIDITERKQAEMEREDLLRKERDAREQAEAANRGKDEFVAMVSHELRSPLNAMLGWSKILKKGGVDAKTQSHAVEVIERSARAQQTLIEDLLDMARIVGGKLRLETRPVSLARVVEAAADVVRPAAEAREIELLPSINSADEVTGDPDRLQQVVWNLLSNAVKFTTRGGSIKVILERVGASAQITVTDTGRGIKAEDLPFIFDRFRQADSSGSRRFAGLGLGLALVKHLVELHGGQVYADSLGEGKGASFIVRLPVRAVRGEATPARGMDRASMRTEERDGRAIEREARGDYPQFPLDGVWVLIVDDEADARELIATLLKQYGARVTVASCAAEAFDKLRKGEAGARPDVLVSDISMPDEDGYMLIERVRKLPPEEGGKIPAIALTALERANDRIKALASGFSMHVPKPVEPEELAMVIANLTGHPAGIIL
jgi:PAS domain S-box-containing protein